MSGQSRLTWTVKSDDADLVRRFASTADPRAFESLLRRHGPMVYGVCRRMLRDPHEADDAFQATFLVLLQRARWVRPPDMVGHWLYGVARRTSLKTAAMKRKRIERERNAEPRPALHEFEQSDLRSLLDSELARMPERYRAPIVLCELDGMSRREAAHSLKLSEGTLSSRLSRARDLLRTRLTRRGLAFSAGALVAGLTAESASAFVPAPLLTSTVHFSAVSASVASWNAAGLLPDSVLTLAKGVIKAMWISKIQSVATTAIVLGTLGGGAGVVTHQVIAYAKEPSVAKEDGKGSKEIEPETVSTPVFAVDADPGTITVSLPEPGKKVPPSTLKLAKDVPVEISGIGKGSAKTPGKLADVTPGINVTITLSPDRATVTHIQVEGEYLVGIIKSVDAAAHAVTVIKKNKTGEVEKTLPVHADAQISFSNYGKTKLAAPDNGAFSDLAPGADVAIHISADRSAITSITINGKSASGSVSAVDPSKRTITVSSKGEAEQTFTIVPDAAIALGEGKSSEGTLADVSVGMAVNVQLSPHDPKSAVSLHAWTRAENPEKK